jgi:hypothetical protein
VPGIQELPMPHLVFQSPITLDDVHAQLDSWQVQAADGIYIHFLRVWRSKGHLLIETHVKEPTIDQHVAITLAARDECRFTLQLSALGHPRPTPGIHQAVKVLGDWLVGLHPDAKVIVSKLQDEA